MHESLFNLANLYHESKIAHAYLIETNDIPRCVGNLKEVIKQIIKENSNISFDVDSLIDKNEFSNLLIIEPDGKEIKKDQIDNLKLKFSMVPTLFQTNFYFICNADKMNIASYNKLLKFLEEPEDNIIGFLITDNKDAIAPTIVSRCSIIRINYEKKKNDFNEIFDIEYYISLIKDKKFNIVWYNENELLKKKFERVDYIKIVQNMFDYYKMEYLNEKSEKTLLRLNILSKYLKMIKFNVNIELFVNSMCLELGETYE